MKKFLFLFIFSILIESIGLTQVIIGQTRIDTLVSMPYITVTLRISYLEDKQQARQPVKDCTVDLGKRGSGKLRNVTGEVVRVESLTDLLNIFSQNGWEMQQFSFIPYNSVKPDINAYVNELLYTIVFRRK